MLTPGRVGQWCMVASGRSSQEVKAACNMVTDCRVIRHKTRACVAIIIQYQLRTWENFQLRPSSGMDEKYRFFLRNLARRILCSFSMDDPLRLHLLTLHPDSGDSL
jgi:hypothetical protein